MSQGKQVETLNDLIDAAYNAELVISPRSVGFTEPRSATFLVGMEFRYIVSMINRGLYIYESENESKQISSPERKRV